MKRRLHRRTPQYSWSLRASADQTKKNENTVNQDPVILALTGIRFRTPQDKADAVRVIHSMLASERAEYDEESRYRLQMIERELTGPRDQIARLEASIHQIHRDHGQQLIDAITRNPEVPMVFSASNKEATDGKRNR